MRWRVTRDPKSSWSGVSHSTASERSCGDHLNLEGIAAMYPLQWLPRADGESNRQQIRIYRTSCAGELLRGVDQDDDERDKEEHKRDEFGRDQFLQPAGQPDGEALGLQLDDPGCFGS